MFKKCYHKQNLRKQWNNGKIKKFNYMQSIIYLQVYNKTQYGCSILYI